MGTGGVGVRSVSSAAFSPQPCEVACQCVGSPYPPVPLWGTVHLTYGYASAYHFPAGMAMCPDSSKLFTIIVLKGSLSIISCTLQAPGSLLLF